MSLNTSRQSSLAASRYKDDDVHDLAVVQSADSSPYTWTLWGEHEDHSDPKALGSLDEQHLARILRPSGRHHRGADGQRRQVERLVEKALLSREGEAECR